MKYIFPITLGAVGLMFLLASCAETAIPDLSAADAATQAKVGAALASISTAETGVTTASWDSINSTLADKPQASRSGGTSGTFTASGTGFSAQITYDIDWTSYNPVAYAFSYVYDVTLDEFAANGQTASGSINTTISAAVTGSSISDSSISASGTYSGDLTLTGTNEGAVSMNLTYTVSGALVDYSSADYTFSGIVKVDGITYRYDLDN